MGPNLYVSRGQGYWKAGRHDFPESIQSELDTTTMVADKNKVFI